MLITVNERRRELREAIESGRLIRASPIVEWGDETRVFLMCPSLAQSIEMGIQSQDEVIRTRWAKLKADISAFIEGRRMTQNRIKPLHEYRFEHWELISRRPKPSLRVFGRFALPNYFIGTHVVERQKLGGFNSIEFELEKLACEEHWNNSGLSEPFSDTPRFCYKAYITENASRRTEI